MLNRINSQIKQLVINTCKELLGKTLLEKVLNCLVALLLSLTLCYAYAELSYYEIINSSPENANARLYQAFNLPKSAKSINAYTSHKYTIVSFEIMERDFISWCNANHWVVKKLDEAGATVFGRYNGRTNTDGMIPVYSHWEVRRGYEVWQASNTSHPFFFGVFDKDRQMASLTYSSR